MPVSGFPVPRAASSYSLNSECDLVSLNLAFNGTTGRLSGNLSSNDSSPITCEVTAYQGPGLNFTTKLHISPEALTYQRLNMPGEDVLFFSDTSEKQYQPTVAQGVGPLSNFTVKCTPTVQWLQVSDTGTLTSDGQTYGGGGIYAPNYNAREAVDGGVCIAAATQNGTWVKSNNFAVVRAPLWTSFSYPPYWTSTSPQEEGVSYYTVTAGGAIPALTPVPVFDGNTSALFPTSFSMTCVASSGNISFVYDEFTGSGTYGGYDILELDPTLGTLIIQPSANITNVMDLLGDNTSLVKLAVQIKCSVFAFYGLRGDHYRYSDVQIDVQDDNCWVLHEGCAKFPCPAENYYYLKPTNVYPNLCLGSTCSTVFDFSTCCEFQPPAIHTDHDCAYWEDRQPPHWNKTGINLSCGNATWHWKNRCNNDATWSDNKYCQKACCQAGYGYEDDPC